MKIGLIKVRLFPMLASCLILPSCGGDKGPTEATVTSGIVKGTITFTGAVAPSATRLLAVAIYPSSNTNMQGAPNGSTIQAATSPLSGFNYSFELPAGTYHIATVFDANGDGSFNSGNTDPYLIFTPSNAAGTGTFGASAAVFTLVPGQIMLANISFGDSYKK